MAQRAGRKAGRSGTGRQRQHRRPCRRHAQCGRRLCHEPAVRFHRRDSAAAIQWLIDLGVPFTQDSPDHFHLTREGGHSARRIIHAADATGQAIFDTLLSQALARPNLHFCKIT